MKRHSSPENPTPDKQVRNPKMPRPVLQDHGLTVVSKPQIVFAVADLNVFRCPAAICCFLFVSAFVTLPASVAAKSINPIEAMLVARGSAHVFQERIIGFSPSSADILSGSPVPSVVVGTFIVASVDHPDPDFVFTLPGLRISTSASGALTLGGDAKVVLPNYSLHSARITLSSPKVMAANATVERENAHRSEYLPSYVLKTSSAIGSLIGSHDVCLSTEGRLWLEPHGVTAPRRLVHFTATSPTLQYSSDPWSVPTCKRCFDPWAVPVVVRPQKKTPVVKPPPVEESGCRDGVCPAPAAPAPKRRWRLFR
jgi:hypothetical protein